MEKKEARKQSDFKDQGVLVLNKRGLIPPHRLWPTLLALHIFPDFGNCVYL